MGNKAKAQELLDAIPGLIDSKKMGGKDLPTEVFIKKKCTFPSPFSRGRDEANSGSLVAFYQEKQKRRGGDPAKFVEAIQISPAEGKMLLHLHFSAHHPNETGTHLELAIFWNTAAHITTETARAHIKEFANLTPKLSITSPAIEELAPSNVDREKAAKRASLKRQASIESTKSKTSLAPSTASASGFLSGWGSSAKKAVGGDADELKEFLDVEQGVDLDNEDELAVRSLLLGVLHRRLDMYDEANAFLRDAVAWQESGRVKVNTWVGGVAMFERAVCDLMEVEFRQGQSGDGDNNARWRVEWERAMKSAGAKMDKAMALSPSSVDLSSRLDSRVSMLRDEIGLKREALGVAGVHH